MPDDRPALEAVRLVIWDLDDTFWKGTLTEGGIEQYVREHHEIVVELAHRGIMSSICSKNDAPTVMRILEQHGIAEFFIFPSISWDTKGPRLSRLIDAVQLRPATVMFIDDNPNNRGEAQAIIPDLQVEDESFIGKILSDPRFRGRDDRALTRLAQYKLLEARKSDEANAAGSNEDFLRSCDVRVLIDYDLENQDNLDRAIELINRTNQLNYTKNRLPENIETAREVLYREINRFHRQAGLVRVADRYGDYGYVGFFLVETDVFRPIPQNASMSDFRSLVHYCFSCRTLGMLIEHWLYQHLGRPNLQVVGEVLTDLSVPRVVDWVTPVTSLALTERAIEPVAPELRVLGGCETFAIGVYLQSYAPALKVFGNFSSNGIFYRINSSALALSALHRDAGGFGAEAEFLGVSSELIGNTLFAGAPHGTGFVFSGGFDAQRRPHYQHKRFGWELVFELAGCETLDLTAASDEEVAAGLATATRLDPAARAHLATVAQHVRAEYRSTRGITDDQLMSSMRSLIERVPAGSSMVILLDHDRLRLPSGIVRSDPPTEHYNNLMRSVARDYPYVGTACFSSSIDNDDQIQIGGNHYDRAVYVRIAERLAETIRALPPKSNSTEIMIKRPEMASI